MAKVSYVGASDKARRVKKLFVGIDGKARKVKKAYVGIGGVARLFFSSGVQAGAYSILNSSNFVLARWEPPTAAVISQININAYVNSANYPQIPCGATDTDLFISNGTTSRLLDPITGAVLRTVSAPSPATVLSGGMPGVIMGSAFTSGARSWTAALFNKDTLTLIKSGTIAAGWSGSRGLQVAMCTGGNGSRIFAFEAIDDREDGQTDRYGGYRILDANTFGAVYTYGYYSNSSTSAYSRFMGDWYKGIPYYVTNRNFNYGDVAIWQCDPTTYARQTCLYNHGISAADAFSYASTFIAVKG